MGICEVLTIVFIVLKLVNVISWSWFLVLLPEIIAIGFYIIMFIIQYVQYNSIRKELKKFAEKIRKEDLK